MTAEAAALVRSFRVGPYTCTLTIPRPRVGEALCMAAEWSPEPPRRLSRKWWAQYRAGRNAALAELGRQLGGGVAVLEL
jgi:hypothetical protein